MKHRRVVVGILAMVLGLGWIAATGWSGPLEVRYSLGDGWRLSGPAWGSSEFLLAADKDGQYVVGLARVRGVGLRPLVDVDVPDPALELDWFRAIRLEPGVPLPPTLIEVGEVRLEPLRINLGADHGLQPGMFFRDGHGAWAVVDTVGPGWGPSPLRHCGTRWADRSRAYRVPDPNVATVEALAWECIRLGLSKVAAFSVELIRCLEPEREGLQALFDALGARECGPKNLDPVWCFKGFP